MVIATALTGLPLNDVVSGVSAVSVAQVVVVAYLQVADRHLTIFFHSRASCFWYKYRNCGILVLRCRSK